MDKMNGYPEFNFGEISKTNWLRCISTEGFNFNPESNKEFNMYMMICMQEELGEIAGAYKKLYRGFNKRELKKMKDAWFKTAKADTVVTDLPTDADFEKAWRIKQMNKVKAESADLFTYFDLLMTRNQINIGAEVKRKFNQVSEDMGIGNQFKI